MILVPKLNFGSVRQHAPYSNIQFGRGGARVGFSPAKTCFRQDIGENCPKPSFRQFTPLFAGENWQKLSKTLDLAMYLCLKLLFVMGILTPFRHNSTGNYFTKGIGIGVR